MLDFLKRRKTTDVEISIHCGDVETSIKMKDYLLKLIDNSKVETKPLGPSTINGVPYNPWSVECKVKGLIESQIDLILNWFGTVQPNVPDEISNNLFIRSIKLSSHNQAEQRNLDLIVTNAAKARGLIISLQQQLIGLGQNVNNRFAHVEDCFVPKSLH